MPLKGECGGRGGGVRDGRDYVYDQEKFALIKGCFLHESEEFLLVQKFHFDVSCQDVLGNL